MKQSKIYILTFDNTEFAHNYRIVHNTVVNLSGLISWWHYISNTYLIIIDEKLKATDIAKRVSKKISSKFFISEINIQNSNGLLPEKAWDWINKQKDILK